MPVPIPIPTPLPSPTIPLDRRDTYTTATVIASDAATSAASTKSSAFPFAVAIPALVGGMVLAGGAFWFWWWMSKRKKRERRERWERAQRRKRNKANAQPRPSVSSHTAGGPKSPINEKEYASIIPSLPKQSATSPTYAPNHAQNPFGESQREYAPYAPGYPTAPQQGYATQPYIDPDQNRRGYTYDQYGNAVPLPASAGAGGYQYAPTPPESTPAPVATPAAEPSPKTGKRAAARMAVAETAAANASVDPAYRHKPNKPSPLALKAAADAAAAAEREKGRKSTGFRIQPELAAQLAYEAQEEETLAPEHQNQMYGQSLGYDLPQNQGQRQVSGEWGVALSSPNNDGSFAQQQNLSAAAQQSGYSHDPYLQQQRAVSGQYTVDPYAVYHGGEKKEKGQSWL